MYKYIITSILGLLALGGIVYAQTPGGLTVPQGGTGFTSVPAGSLIVGGTSLRLSATTSPTVGYLTATSTTATSTFAGGLKVSGFVSVGTSTAMRRLHVADNGVNSQIMIEDTAGTANNHYWGLNSSNGSLNFNSMTDTGAGTQRMTILNTGNVGIGTTSPTSKLHISAAAGDTSILTTVGNTLTDSATLGSELTDANNWTSAGWTGDYGSGFAHTVGNTTDLSRTMTVSTSNYYQISFTISGRTAGSITVTLGSATTTQSYSANQTHTVGHKPIVANNPLVFTPTSDFNGTISNISVKQITSVNSPVFVLKDSTGVTGTEIRQTLSSLNNTFIGLGAGRLNTTGIQNTAIGAYSLYSNTTGVYNTANGYYSLFSNTTGSSNTANGMYSLYSNTTGVYNTANGYYSLFSNTTGSGNTANGHYSLLSNTTGTGNAAFGYEALRYNPSATSSTAFGYQAGRGASGQANQNNSLFGYQSGYALTTGSNNTLLGYGSGSALTTGSNNILIGYNVAGTSTASTNFLNIGNTIYGNLSSGKVGIGTNNPDTKLQIEGISNGGRLDLLRLNNYGTGYNTAVGIGFGVIRNGTVSPAYIAGNFRYPNNMALDFATGGGGGAGNADGTVRMTIDGAGNVGIGTTSPTTKLEVYGGDFTLNNISSAVPAVSFAEAGSQKAYVQRLGSTQGIAGRQGNLEIGTVGSNDIEFWTNSTAKMRITYGGNVGIGTTTPVANFQVTAAVNATTTLEIGRGGSNKGSCVKLYDATGVAWYYTPAVGTGALTSASASSCASVTGF